jgi:hypothetical protein
MMKLRNYPNLPKLDLGSSLLQAVKIIDEAARVLVIAI